MTTSSLSATATLRIRGELSALSPREQRELFDRSSLRDSQVSGVVTAIIERVRNEGDDALFAFARDFDCIELPSLEVPGDAVRRASARLDTRTRDAIERAARNIERVHRAWLPSEEQVEVEPGVIVSRRPDPLRRVGVYAPGGRAAYPSSVLMGAIPARVAGVGEIVLCSPPGESGIPPDSVLAAAAIAGVDRIFAIGGAGAIAAMALGTATVPRVDKIVGPGNAFVAEAKIQLADAVAFDSPAGPSELVVIADESANPAVIAREVLAQAEHDPRAVVLAIAIGKDVAERIEAAVVDAVGSASRTEIITESLRSRGGIVWVSDAMLAIDAASRFAPEHLMVATQNPAALLNLIRNAGAVFLGETSSVVFGDYVTGANHVLPTGGLARCYSGLSTIDFFRWTTWQSVTAEAAARLSSDTAVLAGAERLYAHAAAAAAWEKGT
ncbi:MAG TPA: histidinol dehydrogenase [Gemmatimonadaceae bacterium]